MALPKIFYCISFMFLLTLVIYKLYECDYSWSKFSANTLTLPKVSKETKWIVITSINHPTEDVKRLASLKDWTVVVVADTKTPKDWNWPGVHFLSVEKQLSLGLSLPRALPFKTYTRKNVGYLYAIMNGAEWIYDTDDDNKPYGLGLEQFDYGETISGLRYTPRGNLSEKLFNPYHFFGYKDMWPRGFPLEYLSDHTNGEDRMISCREMRPAAVQQGIVHKDPDVDAVYRLLHADRKRGLNVTFNKYAPPILLEAGTYSPWNSQNTLFHRRAFFTMFLPSSVEFRVTDIWRSYFAQKMLHLTGESVAFYPVNAVQFRNAHNYLTDFKDEIAVYTKSGEIVNFIENFVCTSTSIINCFMELARGFVENDFMKMSELPLIKAWISDLMKIGYKFPALAAKNNMKVNITEFRGNCRSSNVDLSVEAEQSETNATYHSVNKVQYFDEILSWCNRSDFPNLPSFKAVEVSHKAMPALEGKRETVAVFINNYPWKQSIGLLQRLYSPYFATIVFCGSWNPNEFLVDELEIIKPKNFVNLTEEEAYKGRLYYYCVSKVRDLRLQNVKGYYFIADDAVFNFWHELPLNVSVRSDPEPNTSDRAWWTIKAIGEDAAKKFVELMEGKYSNDRHVQNMWKKYDRKVRENGFKSAKESILKLNGRYISDLFYVTTSDLDFFADLSEYLTEARMFVEIATLKILNAISSKWMDNFTYTWHVDPIMNLDNYTSELTGMHPVKLSYLHTDQSYKNKFCSTVISTFFENLFQFN